MENTNQDQDIRLNLDKTEAPVTPVDTVVADAQTETPSEDVNETAPTVDNATPDVNTAEESTPTEKDASYNCQACLGEGLITNEAFPEGKICNDCQGTGKLG